MLIVSDTSPISNLIQIGQLDLLKQLFGQLIVPPAVDEEVRRLMDFGISVDDYDGASWISVRNPSHYEVVEKLEGELDRGESQAIAIYKELNAELLLIDERLGRRVAQRYGMNTIGLIGCLVQAKNESIIESVADKIEALEVIAGFYIGEKLKRRVLAMVGED